MIDSIVGRPARWLAAWTAVVAVLAGGGAASGGHLSPTRLTVAGGDAQRAERLFDRGFGGQSSNAAVLLRGPARLLAVRGPALTRELVSVPGARVVSPWASDASARLRPNRDSGLILVMFPARDDTQLDSTAVAIRRAADDAEGGGVRASVSGAGIVGRALEDQALAAVHRAELIALPVLLIVLMLVFRSLVAAAIPLLFGVAAVAAGTGVVGATSLAGHIDVFAVTLAAMMGLALGVDYSLLLVTRFRQERAAGLGVDSAVRATALRAGGTVLLAGAALSTALLVALAIAPGGVLLSTVVGALAATVVSVAGALIAMPAVLTLLGRHIERGRLGRRSAPPGRWLPPLRFTLERPAVAAAMVGCILLALATPALGLATGPPDASQLNRRSEVRRDYDAVRDAVGAGWTAPFVVAAQSAKSLAGGPARMQLRAWVAGIVSDTAARAADVQLSRDRRTARITIAAPAGPNDRQTRRLHGVLRARATALASAIHGQVAVGGQPAEFAEFRDALATRAPLLVLSVVLASGLVLFAVFRSPFVPLVALVLNLLAVGAAFGAVALLFNPGGALGGPGFVDDISLVAAFTVVFGLSIDYQVFILDRMREAFARSGNPDVAVREGLRNTAGVVTGAAAIMVAVFVAFATAEMAAIRQLGTALTVAVVLDATLVRLVLLPALVSLGGFRLWRGVRRQRMSAQPVAVEQA